MRSLAGKIAIVTGGGAGIGRATALLLGEQGASVVVADISESRAREVAEEITLAGGSALPQVADVSDEGQVEAMVAAAVQAYGGVDMLHANAAFGLLGGGAAIGSSKPELFNEDNSISVADMTVEIWDSTMAVNLRGTMLCCKYAVREMLKRGGGAIVNTSSAAGLQGRSTGTAYGVSKAAVNMLTQYVATAYGKSGIRCNAVSPGFVETSFALSVTDDASRAMRLRHHLTPYLGEESDVANMVAYLLSDDAKFITGQVIAVDGGMCIHTPYYGDAQ